MFENVVEDETVQAISTLKKIQEQQSRLDTREGKEWIKFLQTCRSAYIASTAKEYVDIDNCHQAIVYKSSDLDLLVTHDSGHLSIIRIYKKNYRYQTFLGLKTKLIPKGYTLLAEISFDFWGLKGIPVLHKIDRSQLDSYIKLYQEMSQYYLDLLKQKTREADEDIAFRQLVKFV